jgi:hypothetical protein
MGKRHAVLKIPSAPRSNRGDAGAFYRVCDVLQLKGEIDDPMTEIVAQKIVDLATGGERDPERLCAAVLASLNSSKRADDA